jgi:PIN domain nuclease of toxin-antitoxin system
LKILLDTYIFLWAINDPERLSPPAAEAIQNLANKILVSIASAWEIAIKVSIGKFEMPVPVAGYLQRQLARHGFAILPIDFSHLAMLEKLPPHHRDPFDRLLIAQCVAEDATLVSVDSRFQGYAVKILS